MKRNRLFTTSIILALFVQPLLTSCSNNTDAGNNTPIALETAGLTLPEGFQATIFANETGKGRHLAVADNGTVFASFSRKGKNDKGLAALRDNNNDGIADTIVYFSDYLGTGVEIYDGYLYFENSQGIYRYPMPEEGLLPDTDKIQTVASGFKEQNQHVDNTFTFDNNGNMYVNIGAPSNACMEQTRTFGSPGEDPCTELQWQAGIWKFSATALNQQLMDDATRYATGIRNALALDWDFNSNSLYAVQHGRDQLSQFYPDLYTDEENAELPAEEFLQVDEGDDFGWPYCYYDQFLNKKVLAPEYGGDGEKVGRCAEKKDPAVAFPGHIAPNDLVFYDKTQFPEKYRNGAFVAFHGSWNRAPEPQEGFLVAFIPFQNGTPTGEWEIFAEGFKGQGTIYSPGDAEFRPCGLATGPEGALYVIDSQEGRIWKISYAGLE